MSESVPVDIPREEEALFGVNRTQRRYCVCVVIENGAPVGFEPDPECPDHGDRTCRPTPPVAGAS